MTTWRVFGLISLLWMAVTLYTNERVLAPEVMAGVVGRTTGVELPVARLDQMRRQGRWAYPLLPVLLAIRVGVAALALQLVAMLMASALPYGVAFRAALWGFAAVVYGTFLRMLRLDLLPLGSLSRAELFVVPDSLAVLFTQSDAGVTILSASLNALTLHDALWIGIVMAYLTMATDLSRRRTFVIALCAWCMTAAARVGGQVFVIGILG